MDEFFNFLDGSKYLRTDSNGCRGCFIWSNREKLPPHLTPIYEDEHIAAIQDAEWPIPGFYIVTVKAHIGRACDIPYSIYSELFKLIYWVRKGQEDVLGFQRCQMYHEERINNPHYHVWLLPLCAIKMAEIGMQPKVYEGNVQKYLKSFSFTETSSKILQYNKLMESYLKKSMLA